MPVISKALGDRILASQERPPSDEGPPKTVISTPSPNALLVIDSGDRFDPSESAAANNTNPQRKYNNFVISRNQNLIQGAFSRIGLTEIRFPFCIPNVNETNNSMWVDISGNGWTQILIDEGFYSGSELATAIQAEINALPDGANITVEYDPNGRFLFFVSTPPTAPTFAMSPLDLTTPKTPIQINSKRSLLDLIGFPPIQYDVSTPVDLNTDILVGGVANLKYTDYIDIVSFQLTNNQKVKDTNTQSLIPRNALICRLYIENETSQNQLVDISGIPANVYGTYPFTIYRQYKNPKMMRWNNVSGIGQVDISLYDMYGNILYVPLIPLGSIPEPIPDFQLTFQVSED